MRVSRRTLITVFNTTCKESNPEVASNLIYDVLTKRKDKVNRRRLAYFYRHPNICKTLGMRLYKIRKY